MRHLFILAALCLSLAGCAVQRPPAVVCSAPAGGVLSFVPVAISQSISEATAGESMFAAIEQVVRDEVARTPVARTTPAAVRVRPLPPITVHVLSLSAGGQYGAFGAGFLRGWSENPSTPRPAFELVTGVSAGALLAPIAFAGPEFDPALDIYRGLSQREVYRTHPPYQAPFRPSLASTEPLKQLLRGQLSDELITRMGERFEDEGAQLIISAANLDTTENRVFNLGEGASARTSFAQRRDCLSEQMLASAAIPGLFPPRNIGGELYADGGLRDHVFFQSVESARAQLARETGREVIVDATIIVNGALSQKNLPVDDSILNYFTRAAEVLADEVLRDSIAEAVAFAENTPGWEIKGVYADVDLGEAGCDAEQSSGTVDPCVTTTLFDAGRALASSVPIDWKDAAELREKAGEL